MEPRLLVIGGYATSGKDAVANALVDELGWYKTYMSKPLEQALLTLNPYIPTDQVFTVRYRTIHTSIGYDESKKIPEVRRLLQTLGTEIGRNMFDENVWLDAVCREVIGKQTNEGHNVVVTGIRYLNEMTRFDSLDAESLWVSRPGVKAVNSHSSDNSLDCDDFDYSFSNEGTLEDLKAWVITNFKE